MLEIFQLIETRALEIFGSPLLLGLALFIFLMGFAVIFRFDTPAFLMTLGLAAFLVAALIPALRLILGFLFGVLIGIALLKVFVYG